jgi:hydroxymethylpyrimidine pyrophosphatase-like HAD family hydrolase
MENGYDYVKKAANYITASNEESGVAKALNKFVNNC